MQDERRISLKEKLVAIFLFTVLLSVLILTGCAYKKTEIEGVPATHAENYQKVECVGQVPNTLKKVIENNTFKGITAFEGTLLKTERYTEDEKNKAVTQKVQMMDIYGNELASYATNSNDAYRIATLTSTGDGGFLFVLGFEDYAYGQGEWASDNGFASRIIKCDKEGNLQFNTSFDGVEGSALRFCFEKDEKFYFFGTIETPETKTQGVYSYTDVYMSILDEKGSVLKSQCIAGSDFDRLDAAECTNNGFILSISSQSDDKDFASSNSNGYPVDWVITVNEDLEITEKKRESGRDYFDTKIGEKGGIPVYNSDDFLNNFDAGTPSAFINYGDFYLIVSENITGVYENTPLAISSIWYYTETVYSGYDNSGNLIFRAAVDSSPDYGTMSQNF